MDVAAGKSITDQLLNLGLQGIVILGLVYAVIKLFNMLQGANEARIVEVKALTEAMVSNTLALEALSKAVEKRSP